MISSRRVKRWLVVLSRGRSLRQLPLLGGPIRAYQDRLTPRGRYLFVAVCLFAILGLDTRARLIYVLFSISAGVYVAATLFGFRPRPRAVLSCRLPDRATSGCAVRVNADVALRGGGDRELFLAWPPPREAPGGLSLTPRETVVSIDEGRAHASFELTPARRGRYRLAGPRLRGMDPLGLVTTLPVALPDHVLLVYPRFYTMEAFDIPVGRRYQPGGIPLTSSTGDAIEFVGTREYRAGDPVRTIHWRSWARRGAPVVKEYQEEYFCRIAVILDTFLPRAPSDAQLASFEGAISVVASIADWFSRSEFVVDILAAGPDVYEVSAGRSLAYLDNILDVLACVEPCYDPPFQTIGPPLFDRLAGLTTVVAVLQDWDPVREAFLRRVRECGVSVRAVIVHDGETTAPWQRVGEELGEIELRSTADVEAAIAAEASGARGSNSPGVRGANPAGARGANDPGARGANGPGARGAGTPGARGSSRADAP